MQDCSIICDFLLSPKYEKICFRKGIDLHLFNLKVDTMLPSGFTFITLLNNFDSIIKILEKSKKLVTDSIFDIPNFIENEISNIDKDLANFFSADIVNFISSYNKHFSELNKNLENTKTLIKTYNNNSDFIEELKENEKEYLDELKKLENIFKNINKRITNSIDSLKKYKTYIDLYYGLLEVKDFKNKNTSYFQSYFNFKIDIPRHQLYQAYMENNQILLINDLMLSVYKELKNNDVSITDDKIYKNIYDKTQQLNEYNQIITLKSYEISSIQDLLCVYFNYFIDNSIVIKKCKNCGKYFIPSSRTDEKYCDNSSPQNANKTCKEYGAKKTYRDKLNSNEIKKAHYTTSQFYRMKITRAKSDREKTLLVKNFDSYKLNYEKQKKKFNRNKLSEEDFINWIIAQKKL